MIKDGNMKGFITTMGIESTMAEEYKEKQLDSIRDWLQLDRSCEVIHSC